MAKRDSFVCPKCGRATIQAVDEWAHDFFAVHRVERIDKPYPMSKLVEWCTPISSVVSSVPIKRVKKIKEEEGLF